MSSLTGLLFVGYDVLSTTLSAVKGMILAQLGDSKNQAVESDGAEIWGPGGFLFRPSKAVVGGVACQALGFRRSDRDVIIGLKDARGQALAANLLDGELCLYAPGTDGTAQGRILIKANGTIALYTAQGNASGGPSVTIQANASDGSIKLANQYGTISMDSSGIKIGFKNGGAIQLDANGISLIGQAIGLNGASVSLGANATQPVVWGPSGVSGVGSTSVKVAV